MARKKKNMEDFTVVLDPDVVIALGNKLVETVEEFIDDNPETILAEIHYALYEVSIRFHKGLDTLPSVPILLEEDEEECLCDDCKRKKELEKITKKHEAFLKNYIH